MSIYDIPKKINPIADFFRKTYHRIKSYWSPIIRIIKNNLEPKNDTFIVLIIILIGLAGFGLGKLSALEKSRDQVQTKPLILNNSGELKNILSADTNIETVVPMSAAAMIATESAQGFLVASKSGKKYHFPWCAGSSQIANKNKIWFATYTEAQKAGYTPASNCPGLK